MNKELQDKNKEGLGVQGEQGNSPPTASSEVPNTDSGKGQAEQPPQEPEQKKKKSAAPNTVVEESGINLIPTMSDQEIKTAEAKKKVGMGSLVGLSLLFTLAILVVAFNITSRLQLNSRKGKLREQEREIQKYSQIVEGNTEVLERIFLYKDIEEGRFSTTLAVDYLQGVISKSGNNSVENFIFGAEGRLEFSGSGETLEELAKLWYILINDSKLENITLRSFSGTTGRTSFSFTGNLVVDEFMSDGGAE